MEFLLCSWGWNGHLGVNITKIVIVAALVKLPLQQKKYKCSGSRKEPEWLTREHGWGKVRDVDRVSL